MRKYFENSELLDTPVKRAAFSDRTSYVMAEMSRLAYFRFEGGYNISEITKKIKSLVPELKSQKRIIDLVNSLGVIESEDKSKKVLSEILKLSGFNLVDTFSNPSTGAQAFLCIQPKYQMAILSFRGTEASLKDIKTDVKARLETVDCTGKPVMSSHEGKTVLIHRGYLEQFNSIRGDIKACLDRSEISELQLFMTGHSLGGALAITATKFLASDSTGACYTFGSPPVGTRAFDYDIKTPIYRVVNHVDIVPRLPSPTMARAMQFLALIIGAALSPFTSLASQIKDTEWYDSLSRVILDAQKYRQSGYGSYLVGRGNNVRLRRSVGPYDRIMWWLNQIPNLFRGEFKLLSDHSVETYSRKLSVWANLRK